MSIRALQNAIVTRPGFVVGRMEPEAVIDNIVNVLVAGNRRYNEISSLDLTEAGHQSALSTLLGRARGRVNGWTTETDKKYSVNERDYNASMVEELQRLFWCMIRKPQPVNDYGGDLADKLLEYHNWTETHVAMPALGYPRRPLLSPAFSGELGPMQLPSECHPWAVGFAALCWELDRPKLNPHSIPEFKTIAGHDVKSKPVGAILHLQGQMETVIAIPMLYTLQGTAMMARLYEPYYRMAAAHALRRNPNSQYIIDQWFAHFERVKAIPLHPLAALVASSTQAVRANTAYGEHDLVLVTDAGSYPYIDGAFTDAVSQECYDMSLALWGDCVSPRGDASVMTTSVTALSKRLRSVSPYEKHFSNIATKLGWSSAPQFKIGTINTVHADFALCNGQMYSEEPSKALAGYMPVLSMGNQLGAGFSPERVEPHFNVALQKWSVMVVDGYQSPTSTEAMYARTTVTAGMWMGEVGCERVQARSLKGDLIGNVIIRFYKEQADEYVKDFYGDSTPKEVWDYCAEDRKRDLAQKALTTAYKADSVAVEDGAFYTFIQPHTPTSEHFYHRVPVRSSIRTGGDTWPSGFTFYDHDGVERVPLDRYESVLFEGHTSELKHGTTLLENVVNIVTVSAISGDADIIGDQVVLK